MSTIPVKKNKKNKKEQFRLITACLLLVYCSSLSDREPRPLCDIAAKLQRGTRSCSVRPAPEGFTHDPTGIHGGPRGRGARWEFECVGIEVLCEPTPHTPPCWHLRVVFLNVKIYNTFKSQTTAALQGLLHITPPPHTHTRPKKELFESHALTHKHPKGQYRQAPPGGSKRSPLQLNTQ